MTINYTTLLGLAEPVTGTQSGTWGDDVNKGITDYLDIAIAGTQTISGSQTAVTLSVTNGSSSGSNIAQAGSGSTGSAQYAIINCTGNPAGLLTVTVPASSRVYQVLNATSTSQSVKIVGAGPTTGVTIVSGEKATVVWNGSDYIKIGNTSGSGSFTDLTVSGNLTLSGGTANGVAYLNGSKVLTTGSALVFNGTQLGINGSPSQALDVTADAAAIAAFRSIGSSGNDKRLLITSGGDNIRLDSANQSGGAASMAFSIGSTEQARLTSTGLGIGTSSPAQKLDVNGAIAIGGTKFFSKISGDSYIWNNTAALNFVDSTGNTVQMKLDSSGNLGLGVTPSAWNVAGYKAFEVGVLGNAIFSGTNDLLLTSNAYYNSGWKYGSTNPASRYDQNGGVHKWFNAPSGTAGNAISFTQAMTLDASGNLLIGTTSGNGLKLDFSPTTQQINGITHTLTSPESFTDIYGCGTGGTWQGVIRFFTSNNAAASERARIDSSGNLLVGTTSGGSGRLRISGSGDAFNASYSSPSAAYFWSSNSGDANCVEIYQGRYNKTGLTMSNNNTGTVTQIAFFQTGTQRGSITTDNSTTAYNTSSDYRLKENIQPMTGALAKVAALKPCTYKWKADGSDGEGFIAHELAEVCPHAVTGEKDAVDDDGKPKYQGIDTSFLVATLTAAIQEQQALINDLRARVAQLESN